MSNNTTYSEGQVVKVQGMNSQLGGSYGTIRGLSSTLPVIGGMYIVEFECLLSKEYPFSCVVVPEVNLTT